MLHIVVTAGHTVEPIDPVECISNIFRGHTGANIAAEAYRRGHRVHWLTSDTTVLDSTTCVPERWHCTPYTTFTDLHEAMQQAIVGQSVDVVIHSAAVSDYRVVEVVTPEQAPTERWLRLAPNPKLIDLVRSAWCFAGVLVKFKLEPRTDPTTLASIAEVARTTSHADLLVANTLAGLTLVGPLAGAYVRVRRRDLATCLLDAIEVRTQGSR